MIDRLRMQKRRQINFLNNAFFEWGFRDSEKTYGDVWLVAVAVAGAAPLGNF